MKPNPASFRGCRACRVLLAGLGAVMFLSLASPSGFAAGDEPAKNEKKARKAKVEKPLSTPDSFSGPMTTGSLIPRRLQRRDGQMVASAPGYVITAGQIQRSGASSLPQLLRTTIPR